MAGCRAMLPAVLPPGLLKDGGTLRAAPARGLETSCCKGGLLRDQLHRGVKHQPLGRQQLSSACSPEALMHGKRNRRRRGRGR